MGAGPRNVFPDEVLRCFVGSGSLEPIHVFPTRDRSLRAAWLAFMNTVSTETPDHEQSIVCSPTNGFVSNCTFFFAYLVIFYHNDERCHFISSYR